MDARTSVIALSTDIARRNAMTADCVLAHSDVAPNRKIDPGEKFSWSQMARHGLGEWVRPSPVDTGDDGLSTGTKSDLVRTAQKQLAAYGYGISPTGELDLKTSRVLRAFQLHFRPKRIDGRLDQSTAATISRLLRTSGRGDAG